MLSIKGTTIKWLNGLKCFLKERLRQRISWDWRQVSCCHCSSYTKTPNGYCGTRALSVWRVGGTCCSACHGLTITEQLLPCVTTYPLGQQHCCHLGLSVPLTSTCSFFYSTYTASGLALFVVGFLFVCLVLWFLWDSVVDVTPLGAVITWIKSFHCSSHTFCFTKNWGGGKCWQEGKRK